MNNIAKRLNWTNWLLSAAMACVLGGLGLADAIAQSDLKKAKNMDDEYLKFDPRADDLDVEVVSEKTESGIKVTYLYFTSHKVGGKPVRIYGIYAKPVEVKGPVPAILFIHGSGQTADESEALGMARHGYPAFSHDWNRPEKPDQPNMVNKWVLDKDGNCIKCENGYLDTPDWINRRALTLLERQPEVDPQKLGVYGFSGGGHHSWNMAAIDKRVKAANPSCGRLKNPKLLSKLHAPIFFHTTSNDFAGRMKDAQILMNDIPVESRRLVSPNENHNMAGVNWEAARLNWFNHYLRGGPALAPSPVMSTASDKGATAVTVKAPAAKSCQLIYSYGPDEDMNRCWFGSPMKQTAAGEFSAELPVKPGVEIWYYANCDYEDNTTLSSKFEVIKPDKAANDIKVSNILYNPAVDGSYPWYFSWRGVVDDHPWHSWDGVLLAVADVAGKPGLVVKATPVGKAKMGLFRAFLRSPSCPFRQLGQAKKISLEVIGTRPLKVRVETIPSGVWTVPQAQRFVAQIELAEGQGWQTIELPVSAFKNDWPEVDAKDHKTLESLKDVKQFHITVESADKARGLPAVGVIKVLP